MWIYLGGSFDVFCLVEIDGVAAGKHRLHM